MIPQQNSCMKILKLPKKELNIGFNINLKIPLKQVSYEKVNDSPIIFNHQYLAFCFEFGNQSYVSTAKPDKKEFSFSIKPPCLIMKKMTSSLKKSGGFWEWKSIDFFIGNRYITVSKNYGKRKKKEKGIIENPLSNKLKDLI